MSSRLQRVRRNTWSTIGPTWHRPLNRWLQTGQSNSDVSIKRSVLLLKGGSAVKDPWRWGHCIASASRCWDAITNWPSSYPERTDRSLTTVRRRQNSQINCKVLEADRCFEGKHKGVRLIAVKAYRESRGESPLMLNLDTYCLPGCVVLGAPQYGAKGISLRMKLNEARILCCCCFLSLFFNGFVAGW
jgi:hypothetical protein